MATSAPTPVNTGSTNVTVSGPPTNSPTSLPPGPGSTGKLYVAPVPPGPPETAPPTVSYANDPGLGVQPDATPVVPVTEASITPPATVIGGGSGSRAVPNYIEVLANGEIVVQNATALNFTGNGVVVTANGAVATIAITSGGTSTYTDANVSALLANFGANTILTSGNITGGYFVGNGSALTGIISSYGNSNVAANLAAFGSNPVSTSGNITGGNILGGANVNATTHTGTTVSVSANVTGGNVLTGGLISATGNITGGNVLGGANVNATTHTGTTVSVSANITGGNVLTGGLISATGNITGGNVLGGANVNATTHTGTTVSVSANITGGNILTGGLISATGNITGGNVLFGAGIVSGTGNITGGNVLGGANVNATTHTGTTVSVSANVTGGNVLTGGLISATGNITGGNLTISGNTATITTANYSIGYLNIPQISLAANSTAALVDSGKHYYSTTSGNLQLTIPDNANVAFPVGTALSLVVQAAGNVLVVTQPSTTLYLGGNSTAGNRVVSAYGMATLMKVATNTWFINGTGVS